MTHHRSIQRPRGQAGGCVAMAALVCCCSLAAPIAAAAEMHAPAVGTLQLPDRLRSIYFEGAAPTVDDLLQMNAYQQSLCRRLMQVTVGIRIGKTNGSGVLISPDGYIMTAAHVAGRPGLRAVIYLPDGRMEFARTLGMNRSIDAALIKLDQGPDGSSPWPFAPLGSLSDLKADAWCVALGHPGGFQPDRQPVVRVGHVLYQNPTEIRSDCELTGGDSGGPLFDLAGRVIGIHSRIGSDLSKNLHVPVSSYRHDWQHLVSGQMWGSPLDLFGRPTRPVIGVMGPRDSDQPLVTSVVRASPAEQAGILPGDRFLQFDGVPIDTFEMLKQQVLAHKPGDTVRVVLHRGDRDVQMSLKIGQEAAPSNR